MRDTNSHPIPSYSDKDHNTPRSDKTSSSLPPKMQENKVTILVSLVFTTPDESGERGTGTSIPHHHARGRKTAFSIQPKPNVISSFRASLVRTLSSTLSKS